MRSLVHRAENQRGRDQPFGRGDELHVRAARLVEDVGRILGERRHVVVAFREPVEQLHARVKGARALLGEFLPEIVAVDLAQQVPLHVLDPGRRNLAGDLVAEARVVDVLVGLRDVRAGDLGLVVGEAREGHAGPEIVAGCRAQIVLLVRVHVRTDVDLVAAALLEIGRGRHVGKLQHVDIETARGALRHDLIVERAGLRAHIAGLDLREVLAEALHDRSGARLVLVAIEHERAFRFRLRDIRVGLEIVDLGDLLGTLRGHVRSRECGRAERNARLEDMAARDPVGHKASLALVLVARSLGRAQSQGQGRRAALCA